MWYYCIQHFSGSCAVWIYTLTDSVTHVVWGMQVPCDSRHSFITIFVFLQNDEWLLMNVRKTCNQKPYFQLTYIIFRLSAGTPLHTRPEKLTALPTENGNVSPPLNSGYCVACGCICMYFFSESRGSQTKRKTCREVVEKDCQARKLKRRMLRIIVDGGSW